MVIAAILVLEAVFFYLLLRGASLQKNWAQEDLEQAEYLEEYTRRREQRRRKKQQTG